MGKKSSSAELLEPWNLSHCAASERSVCRVSFKVMAFKMLAASRVVEKKNMEETNSFEFPNPYNVGAYWLLVMNKVR